jgi:hypothetical protein
MTITTPIHALVRATDDLVREAGALRVTVCEDSPGNRPIHVETLCEDAANLEDAAREMREALPDADPAADPYPEQSREAVGTVTALYLHAEESFRKIDSRARMRGLDEVILPRGGAWHPWLTIVRDEVRRCRRPILAVASALIRSWRDLAQRPEVRLGSATVERLNVSETSVLSASPALAGPAEMQDTPRRTE